MKYNRIETLFSLYFKKRLVEKVSINQYKGSIENFDDYYGYIPDKCNLFYLNNLIQFFVSMYKDTLIKQ